MLIPLEVHELASLCLAILTNDSGPLTYTDDQVTAIKDSLHDAMNAGWDPTMQDLETLTIGEASDMVGLLARYPLLRPANLALGEIFDCE